ncbi:response regulator [Calidifontibacillus erzurumensis]|uniref:DNA-binding domain-containing protein n=1 Tax=Calidifontibacillus erzurumensis TaxID=2741433 RepID=A0A8J8GGU5_9BACI|nr:response regulator [Calidifontibacillus erzurumensis]NSL53144.1 DNA-binding domain-containing protein [Calidifontibacillus erzurumensis]
MNFYILDDDISTRKMLQRIIREELLGDVIGDGEDPIEAEKEIIHLQPDVVLVDLLMPLQDGIETVQHLIEKRFQGKFIMISQIENKEMVARAYQTGVEYFIHKPVNRIEVTAVIRRVLERIKMEQSLLKIKESLNLLPITSEVKQNRKPNTIQLTQEILSDLGILGETGSKDMIEIMDYLLHHDIDIKNISLKSLYMQILHNYNIDPNEKNIKALEQRLRRAINQAMTNLASLGLTDYAHPKFEHFATKFFDFHEVRLKMNEIDEKKTPRTSRVNIRKFLHALYVEVKSRL